MDNDNQTRGKGGRVRLWQTLPRLARLSLLISCWLDGRGAAIDNNGGRSIIVAPQVYFRASGRGRSVARVGTIEGYN